MNDDLLIDFESMHMLQCTICKKKKHQKTFCPNIQILKIVDQIIKLMGLFPLKIHVDFMHPKLFVERNFVMCKKCNNG